METLKGTEQCIWCSAIQVFILFTRLSADIIGYRLAQILNTVLPALLA